MKLVVGSITMHLIDPCDAKGLDRFFFDPQPYEFDDYRPIEKSVNSLLFVEGVINYLLFLYRMNDPDCNAKGLVSKIFDPSVHTNCLNYILCLHGNINLKLHECLNAHHENFMKGIGSTLPLQDTSKKRKV